MDKNDTASALASQALADAMGSIDTGQPEAIKVLAGKFHDSIRTAIDSGTQLESDYLELAANADLVPRQGLERLNAKAKTEAHGKASAALNTARQQAELLQRAGLIGATPTIDPAREALGRGELETLIGTGTPDQLALRVFQVARGGSRDAIAAMHSDYGKALLSARGLEGSSLDEALASSRRVIAETALENAGRHTEGELAAARLYAAGGELSGAIAATSFYMSHLGLGSV